MFLLFCNYVFIEIIKPSGEREKEIVVRKAHAMLHSLSRVLDHGETAEGMKGARQHKNGNGLVFPVVFIPARKPRHGAFRATEQCGLKCKHRDAENASRFVRLHLVRLITDLGGTEFPVSVFEVGQRDPRDSGRKDERGARTLLFVKVENASIYSYLRHKRMPVRCWRKSRWKCVWRAQIETLSSSSF